MISTAGIHLLIGFSFILAASAPFISARGRARSLAFFLYAGFALALCVVFASLWSTVATTGGIHQSVTWIERLDVRLSFTLDLLSLVFCMLITGIGSLVFMFSGKYLEGHPHQGRFLLFLSAFMSSMLGLVLAADLVSLFVFWELTSITSYFLIGFKHEDPEARRSARQALLVTALCGQALLAGFILLALAGGSFQIPDLIENREKFSGSGLHLAALCLILIGAFAKSAQFPFHFWLPGAMLAPTPVSAYLHSATMVKAGIYLLMRLHPVFAATPAWSVLVFSFGAVTFLLGGVLALRQTDLKLILAYMTVNMLGLLTLLLGIGSKAALAAAIVFLVGHSLYKGALFLAAGAIDHQLGTRDIRELSGSLASMRWLRVAALLAAASMAGIPPWIGFMGKELAYTAGVEGFGAFGPVVILLLAGMSTVVAAALLVVWKPSFGRRRSGDGKNGDPSAFLLAGPVVLGLLSLIPGFFPSWIMTNLVSPFLSLLLGPADSTLEYELWHGISAPLLLSAASLASGILIYSARARVRHWISELSGRFALIGPARFYDRMLDGMQALALLQTDLLQRGGIRKYLRATVGAGLLLVILSGWTSGVDIALPPIRAEAFYDYFIFGIVLFAAFSVVLAATPLAAIISMGLVGYSLTLLYLIHGAPDLAMTQFLVETLTAFFVALIFFRFPEGGGRIRLRAYHPLDVLLSLLVGASATIGAWAVLGRKFDQQLGDYYAAHSVEQAFGRNVVNVILVDFRALDTLGEVTVIGLAGLGVFALIRRKRAGAS